MTRRAALMLQIATGDPRPINRQIVDGVRRLIASGELEAGAALQHKAPVELLALAAEEASRFQASVEGQTVPVAGDVVDFFYQSNSRNLKRIRRHLDRHHPGTGIIEG